MTDKINHIPIIFLHDDIGGVSVSMGSRYHDGSVHFIHQTLDQSGTSVDAQWVKECKDRVAALERGEMDLVGFDEAMAELRRR